MAKVQILIEMDERGQVSVTGPLANKVLCYGILATAADIIREAGQAAPKIVAPSNGDVLSISRT